MGTDINLIPQRRDPVTDLWHKIDDSDFGYEWKGRDSADAGAFARSYSLFGRLMGTTRAPDIVPLFPDRGLPDARYQAHSEDLGEHGHSWATFAELLAADWQGFENSGFVGWLRSPEVAAMVDEHGGGNLRLLFWMDS